MNDIVQYWDIFKRKLKELGGINPLIRKLKEDMDKIEKQIADEEHQKKGWK